MYVDRCSKAIQRESKIGFSALNNGKTVRKACQDCALCGVPPPKWPSIPEDAALSNISWWDVMEKCMTSSAMEQRGSSDLGTRASVMTNIIRHQRFNRSDFLWTSQIFVNSRYTENLMMNISWCNYITIWWEYQLLPADYHIIFTEL